jgi:SAM-dependent methyltransferase
MSLPDLVRRVAQTRDWMLQHAAGAGVESAVRAHVAGFADDERIASWVGLYRDAIAPAVGGLDESIGLDFGCWSGLGTSLLSMLGPRMVIGVDLNAPLMEFARAWSSALACERARFAVNHAGVIPLLDASVDWVYVNQVFCNMHREEFDHACVELARVLRPGGRLVVCDSNNPHCPEVRARLSRTHHACEIGPGDTDRPQGSIFAARLAHIRTRLPHAAEAMHHELARHTCYLWGASLDRAIDAFACAGTMPTSRFLNDLSRAPVHLEPTVPAGNLTDPFWLAARFSSLGIATTINTAAAEGPRDPSMLLDLLRESQAFYVLGVKR